jgi:hypothetical protein
MENPQIIAKAQLARREARHQQLGAIQDQKAAREAEGRSLADAHEQTGIDRSALSKLENVGNENI